MYPDHFVRIDSQYMNLIFHKILFASLGIHERMSLKSCLDFLTSILAFESSSEVGKITSQAFEGFGYNICLILYVGIGGEALASMISRIAEVLLQMSIAYPTSFRQWTEKLMSSSDFPSPLVTLEDKQAFVKALLAYFFYN